MKRKVHLYISENINTKVERGQNGAHPGYNLSLFSLDLRLVTFLLN